MKFNACWPVPIFRVSLFYLPIFSTSHRYKNGTVYASKLPRRMRTLKCATQQGFIAAMQPGTQIKKLPYLKDSLVRNYLVKSLRPTTNTAILHTARRRICFGGFCIVVSGIIIFGFCFWNNRLHFFAALFFHCKLYSL